MADFKVCNECTGAMAPMCKSKEACQGMAVKFEATIAKADDEARTVYGWASIIAEKGTPIVDSQGDIIDEATLVKAAERFMLDSRESGDAHGRTRGIGKVTTSVVFTKEMQQLLGIDLGKIGWWVGMKIADDAVWKKIKAGEYAAFSIGGRGRRQPVA